MRHDFVLRADHDLCSECGETLENGHHHPIESTMIDLAGLNKQERKAVQVIVMGMLNQKTLHELEKAEARGE